MAKQEYSKYQKDVISNYYGNLDAIMLGKLSELVSELYLADTDTNPSTLSTTLKTGALPCSRLAGTGRTRRDRLWQRAQKAMANLKIPGPIIDHIIAKKDVKILAKNLNDWLARQK
jgi:hypothetical protein